MSIIKCTLFSLDITSSGFFLSSREECPFCYIGITKSSTQIDFTSELSIARKNDWFRSCMNFLKKERLQKVLERREFKTNNEVI